MSFSGEKSAQVMAKSVLGDGLAGVGLLQSGWWLSPTPLKNDGVRQLGL